MKMDLLLSDAFARIRTHSTLGLSREAVYTYGCCGGGMVLATALLGMQRSSGFTKIQSAVTKGPSFRNVAGSLAVLELSTGTADTHDRRRLALARSLRELFAGTIITDPHDGLQLAPPAGPPDE